MAMTDAVAISLDSKLLAHIDRLVANERVFPNRSRARPRRDPQ